MRCSSVLTFSISGIGIIRGVERAMGLTFSCRRI
jgi:hypothetical protein